MSYAIYVGRERSRTGHAFLAGYGDEPSGHWLELAPRQRHAQGSTITVGVTPAAEMPGLLTTIPQACETARNLRVSYSHYLGVPAPLTNGGLNEHGVAVRDVWSPSCEALIAMTPSDQIGPNYSDLARIVLERATSARHGVELIGALIAEHGYSTYGGNSHLIADHREAWVVIEYAGGKRLWVAERLNANAIRVSRPGYIATVPTNFNDHEDFLAAPHFVSFAEDAGWYDAGRDGAFDANRVYGDGQGRWAGVRWVEEQLALRAQSDGLDQQDLIWALREPRLTGDSAGYGQLVELKPVMHAGLQTLWHAPIGPIAAPLTPFLLCVDALPPELERHRYLGEGESAVFMDGSERDRPVSPTPQGLETTRSAVAIYKRLLYQLCEHHERFLPEVTPAWEALERELAQGVEDLVVALGALLSAGQEARATRLATSWCSQQAIRALDLADVMSRSMDARSQLLSGVRRDATWRGPEQLW